MSDQRPSQLQNQGTTAGPYNPAGAPNWGQNELTPLGQTVQALVQAVQGLFTDLGGVRTVP